MLFKIVTVVIQYSFILDSLTPSEPWLQTIYTSRLHLYGANICNFIIIPYFLQYIHFGGVETKI